MKFKFSICAVVLAILPTASAQVASHPQPSAFSVPSVQLSQPTGKAVARVNGVVLTDKDLVREEYLIFPYAKQHDGKIPASFEPGIRQGALEMIIFEELVYQDAQKRKLTISPDRLTKAEADLRKQFDTPSQYRQYLQTEFQGNEPALREKIKRSLLIEQLLKTEVDEKSTVSAAELRAYYDKNPARFQYPESFAIQTITIMSPAKATPAQLSEARKRADDAYKQAKATKNAEEFGLLAEKISEDDYRVMMGDHKWVARDKMPPEMLQPALKMKDGQMSDLIQVGPFYVIFRLNKHVPAGKTPFEDVKVPLRKELEKQKTNEVRAAFDKKLRQSAKVETL
ncbi:MAG: peptidyl-prolyl cis-trans isomerase [Candidatus Korobacteraceae bacterium]|jgi:peptidyl-prolyl cis-trans isomerase SurA